MSETRVMVDIETLGTEPGCAILSIGAVMFDEDGLGEEFHRGISITSNQELGLHIDADTLEWWLKKDTPDEIVLTGDVHLRDALRDFSEWVPEDAEVWANSPAFDLAILEEAYKCPRCGEVPWDYWDQRDQRTLMAIHGEPDIERKGIKHHALYDARYQAQQVAAVLRDIGGER